MPTNNINMHGWNYSLYDRVPRTKSRAQQLQRKLKSEGKSAFLNPRKRKSGTKWFVYWKLSERFKKQVIRSSDVLEDSRFKLKRLKKAIKQLEDLERLNPAQKRRLRELKQLIKKEEQIIKKEEEKLEKKKQKLSVKRMVIRRPKTETDLLIEINRLETNLLGYKRSKQPQSYIREREKQLHDVEMEYGRLQLERKRKLNEQYEKRSKLEHDEIIKQNIKELKRTKGLRTKQDFQKWSFTQKTHIITVNELPKYLKFWDEVKFI